MLSPSQYRKITSDSPQIKNNDFSRKISPVDSLQINKVEQEDNYFPFGSQGGGAPLRNSNNDLVSRLPNINENLWQRYAQEKTEPQSGNIEKRKREIHNIIDSFSQGNINSNYLSNNQISYVNPSRYSTNNNFNPNSRSNVKSESYWNDWFGRPGAGAPNWSSYKQNLDDMLEPRRSKNPDNNILTNQPYVPTIGEPVSRPGRKVNKSNHHNRYEIA